MSIKNKNRDPKKTDFKSTEIIVNIKEGTLFYKDSKNNVYRVQGDNLSTAQTELTTNNIISADLILTGSLNGGSF